VLLPPSPKFHCREVGLPVDVSVNRTDCPAAGEAGLYVKDATTAGTTVMVWVAVSEPEEFVAVNATVLLPAVANTWLGFWAVLVPPSPKFHCQEVGFPAEVSVNCTVCPAAGEAGLYVKDAASGAPTVTVRVVLFDPEALIAISATVLAPAVANTWLGFWAVLVPPSPKFHCQEVGFPVEVSVNCTVWPAIGEAGLYVKAAARDDVTDIDWIAVLEPELLTMVNVTVFGPAVV
jgi:hypothetical protein